MTRAEDEVPLMAIDRPRLAHRGSDLLAAALESTTSDAVEFTTLGDVAAARLLRVAGAGEAPPPPPPPTEGACVAALPRLFFGLCVLLEKFDHVQDSTSDYFQREYYEGELELPVRTRGTRASRPHVDRSGSATP